MSLIKVQALSSEITLAQKLEANIVLGRLSSFAGKVKRCTVPTEHDLGTISMLEYSVIISFLLARIKRYRRNTCLWYNSYCVDTVYPNDNIFF